MKLAMAACEVRTNRESVLRCPEATITLLMMLICLCAKHDTGTRRVLLPCWRIFLPCTKAHPELALGSANITCRQESAVARQSQLSQASFAQLPFQNTNAAVLCYWDLPLFTLAHRRYLFSPEKRYAMVRTGSDEQLVSSLLG